MREVLFVREAGDLALATSHLAQSSSASRFTAGAFAFFILSQSGDRPDTNAIGAFRFESNQPCASRIDLLLGQVGTDIRMSIHWKCGGRYPVES